jgi:hypothetical protein
MSLNAEAVTSGFLPGVRSVYGDESRGRESAPIPSLGVTAKAVILKHPSSGVCQISWFASDQAC